MDGAGHIAALEAPAGPPGLLEGPPWPAGPPGLLACTRAWRAAVPRPSAPAHARARTPQRARRRNAGFEGLKAENLNLKNPQNPNPTCARRRGPTFQRVVHVAERDEGHPAPRPPQLLQGSLQVGVSVVARLGLPAGAFDP
jgi:hypothetical protein